MALKEHTREYHDLIENAPLSKLIMSGAINKKQWDMLVRQKAYVYRAIEDRISLPKYAQLAIKVELDLHTEYTTLLESTHEYLRHLRKVPEEQIWAHVYVHYLGEMFGGQIMAKKIPYENKQHMKIEHRMDAIAYIRGQIEGKDALLKDEAISAFKLMLDIHNEIFTRTTASF